jgi:hypothetical protein
MLVAGTLKVHLDKELGSSLLCCLERIDDLLYLSVDMAKNLIRRARCYSVNAISTVTKYTSFDIPQTTGETLRWESNASF